MTPSSENRKSVEITRLMPSLRGNGCVPFRNVDKRKRMPLIKEFFKDLKTPLQKNVIYLMMRHWKCSRLLLLDGSCEVRTPYEVGLAVAIIPVMGLIGMLSRFGFDIGLVGFLPDAGENSRAMTNSCFTTSGLAGTLISLIFLIGLSIRPLALLICP